ncbi:MAG: endonuclease MutS2 [Dehalococcoidia bacterium]|nr:endonuclease MutS2 [Dehalococcoidia bacterium]
MNTKDLALLEFPAVRNIIAGYCTFSLSRDLALALMPSDDIELIQESLSASAQAGFILAAEPFIGVSDLEDIAPEASAAALGKILDPKTLVRIRVSLESLRFLRTHIIPHREKAPCIASKASSIGDFAHVIKAIAGALSPSGDILPNASPKLEAIRRQTHDTRSTLVASLQSFIAADSERRFIQEPIVTEREGRYVVAVKKDRRGDVSGIVHDISNTGATIFVEPWQTLEMGNTLKELQIEEVREIERILAEISELVGKMSAEICTSLQAAAAIDLEVAKARYAKSAGATEAAVYVPGTDNPPIIRLSDARHPLLSAGAVPFNLELGRDFSILMITGPNTGGKTVSLKTIGLLCLMTQAGLPIPAGTGTRLPVFNGIFADIGDEQSIHETMSTFGWHMSNISRILREAKGTSLVLLDELCSSTDPHEGASLARAIIQHLLKQCVLGMITTHYAVLKVFAHATHGLQNASFDFDPHTLRPTYHLTLGTPGGSNAIATAAGFKLPDEVIACARNSLSQGAREMENLLTGLQTERSRLAQLTQTMEIEKRELALRLNEVENELKKLNAEKQYIIQDARDKLVTEMANLQKEIRLASAALKHEQSAETINSARQITQTTREHLKTLSVAENIPVSNDTDVAVGDSVWLTEFGVEACVVSINERSGQIEASAGPLRFQVSRDTIRKTTTTKQNQQVRYKSQAPLKDAPSELDLRGRRAGEVEQLFDSYIGDAALSGRRNVRIIHGFGTGAVRTIIRDQAACHPLVKSFHAAASDEGGDGATIIELK